MSLSFQVVDSPAATNTAPATVKAPALPLPKAAPATTSVSTAPATTTSSTAPAAVTPAAPTPVKTVATTTATVSSPAPAPAPAATPDKKPLPVGNPDMVCPVLPDEKADLKYAATYAGKIYYFCCARCVAKFVASPAQYVAPLEGKSTVYTTTENPPQPAATDTSSSAPVTEPAPAPQVTPPAKPAPAPAPVLSNMDRAIRFGGSLHPLVLHFPIVLLMTAALAEFLLSLTGRHFFAPVSLFSIRLGAILAVLAALSGWATATGETSVADTAWVLEWHRWLGTGVAGAAVLAAIASFFISEDSERGWFRWLLYLIAVAVAVTGHFGGSLVYGLDYFKW